MTRISAALVALAAALLSQLEQAHASLILRVPDEENVVLAEVTMPFNHLVGLRANETYTPSRESLPVTFVNDELMTSLCEVFQSDSIGDAYAGHLLVFHDGLDFMCHGTIGKQIDYKYMEKWCQLNASIVMFSQTYDYMLAHPMDRFREILAGEAGDAVASCFWARGRAVTSDEASTALTMVQENPGLYLGNVSINYTRFKRSIGWLVWTGVMSVTFFAVSIMGIRILVHRLRISYQISAMHVIVLCINICVTFILGSISAAKLACRVPMGLVLLVYQDFFTLGTATSVLLVDIYADASEHLSLDKGHSFRKWRKRSFVVALFLLLAVEFFADYAVMGNNTGGESMLVVIIAPTLIFIQIVVIASLWRKTTETANLLRNAHLSQQNTSTILFREIELHLRFWVRISVIAAVGAIVTLVLVASGFIESQYNLVRGLFDASRCLGLLAEINACKSLRKPKSKRQRKLSSKANPRSVAKKRQSRTVHPRSTMATVVSVNRAADANSNSGIDMIDSLVTEDTSSRDVNSEIQEVRSDRQS